MTLQTLKQFDRATSNNILAAAALSTAPETGLGQSDLVREHKDEVDSVLREIRRSLSLPVEGELSMEARTTLNERLSREIHRAIFPSSEAANAALTRAGQAGRLSPTLYQVQFPEKFVHVFCRLGLRKRHVEDAIHRPDDMQHLMTDGAVEGDVISLFMKRVLPAKREPYWLLVQTHRVGLTQVAQSAWRIYPTSIDLTKAECPLDVLKSFVEVYGYEIALGGKKAKFVESEVFEGDAGRASVLLFGTTYFNDPSPAPRKFGSISHVKTTTPNVVRVGIAYCIDMDRYERDLRAHGFSD